MILFIDQFLKIWVKTHMCLCSNPYSPCPCSQIPVAGNWFTIDFVENEGMAFGMRFGGDFGKLILSLFRIVAVGAIGYYILKLIKENADKLLIISISFIFAGAMGNIIDSAFYGLIFNDSNDSIYHIATIFPKGGGYAPFLHGKVVDMLSFTIFKGHFPSWFPIWGNEDFKFFEPVFNIADSSISCGVIMLILFQRRFFKKETIIVPETTNEDSNITE